MAAIDFNTHCQYDEYLNRWGFVRAYLDGEPALKSVDLCRVGNYSAPSISSSANLGKLKFLRLINPTDKSDYNNARNHNYIEGAVLTNYVIKTQSGLLGMLFRKEPTKPELPESIAYIFDNVNGAGLSMEQQARSVAADVFSIGRDGLLTDMPRNNDGAEVTAADVNNGFRAGIHEYKAESIHDWHEKTVGGVKVLDLLVLAEVRECYCDANMINRENKNIRKVYRLTDSGVTVQIYIEGKDGYENYNEGGDKGQVPVMNAGKVQATKIPFVFIGSVNNEPSIDRLPLEPIAKVNNGHYQESANLASSSFSFSAGTLAISDDGFFNAAADLQRKNETLNIGENSAVIMKSGGKMEIVTPAENNLATGIKNTYKEDIISLGAQIISNGGQAETTETTKIKRAADVSDAEVISSNISNGYSQSLEYVCLFMGVDYDDYKYMLNSEFFEHSMTMEEAVKASTLWQTGAISKDVLDSRLVKGGVIAEDVDLELMNDAIEEEQGGALGFDEPIAPVVE